MSCIIKWTGSKRAQSNTIIKHFPKEIETYYEPFLGGGSVLYALLNSDIKVNKIICSDINSDLINLWNTIKNNPQIIVNSYKNLWLELNNLKDHEKQKEYFYLIRKKFNNERKPDLFMFLTRTSTNGLVRYNKKGEYNSSFHFGRKGINPKTLEEIVLH